MENKDSNLEVQEYEINYKACSLSRLFACNFFDLFCVAILSLLILLPTLFIIQSTPSYISNLESRNSILIESKLYLKSCDNVIKLIDSLENDTQLTYDEKSSKLDQAYSYFFTTFINLELDNKGLETYQNIKIEAKYNNENLFNSNYERIFINSDYDKIYYDFYKDTYSTCIGYLPLNETYLSTRRYINIVNLANICSIIAFSFVIVYYVVPCFIFSRGKMTLGMKLTRLAMLDVNGLSCSWKRFTLRFLFVFFIEFIGSIFSFLIPIFISVAMNVFFKTKQGFADWIFNTYIVSSEDSLIYKSAFEYKRVSDKNSSSTLIEDLSKKDVNFK